MSKILAIFVIVAAIGAGLGVARAADSSAAHYNGERWRCGDNPGGSCS